MTTTTQPRLLQPEIFPAQVDLENPWTKTIRQGGAITCTRVSGSNVPEALAHNAGINAQYSARFWWYCSDKSRLSVESAVEVLNRNGVCREELCPYIADDTYPYTVRDLDTPPAYDAWRDAQASGIKIKVQRIAGRWECARALAKGSPLWITRIGGNMEHCECVIGYHQDKGLKVQGSGVGSGIYWSPWSDLGTVITQVYKVIESPWPMKVHPDYQEGSIPTYNAGALWLPTLRVYQAYPEPPLLFKDATVHFTASNTGVLQKDDPDVMGAEPSWSSARRWLALPALMYFNPTTLLWERWERVSLANPSVDIVSFTQME